MSRILLQTQSSHKVTDIQAYKHKAEDTAGFRKMIMYGLLIGFGDKKMYELPTWQADAVGSENF